MRLCSFLGVLLKRKHSRTHEKPSRLELVQPPQIRLQKQDTIQDSPLLTLPAEIRLMIFEKIVGSQYLLHVTARSDGLCHSKCCDISINEIRKREDVQQEDGLAPLIEVTQPPTFRSHTSTSCYCEDDEPAVSATNLLQTCRQIYIESTDLLYSLNTFEFSHPETFLWFSRTIAKDRLAIIKSLHVGFFPEKDFRPHWSFLAHNLWFQMCDVIVMQMPGLRNLHVSLRDWEMSEWQRQDRLLRPFSSLRGLHQISIEVAEATGPKGHRAVHISPFARNLKMDILQPKDISDK
jgi:hypothetical protein